MRTHLTTSTCPPPIRTSSPASRVTPTPGVSRQPFTNVPVLMPWSLSSNEPSELRCSVACCSFMKCCWQVQKTTQSRSYVKDSVAWSAFFSETRQPDCRRQPNNYLVDMHKPVHACHLLESQTTLEQSRPTVHRLSDCPSLRQLAPF